MNDKKAKRRKTLGIALLAIILVAMLIFGYIISQSQLFISVSQ